LKEESFLLNEVTFKFLALKVVNFIGGIAAQLLLLASGAKGATGAMAGLNMIIRANPLGVLITVIQGAVIAWIVFGDKIKNVVDKNNFTYFSKSKFGFDLNAFEIIGSSSRKMISI
jgi:hypothetical protein